jgi:hypothetical protein
MNYLDLLSAVDWAWSMVFFRSFAGSFSGRISPNGARAGMGRAKKFYSGMMTRRFPACRRALNESYRQREINGYGGSPRRKYQGANFTALLLHTFISG